MSKATAPANAGTPDANAAGAAEGTPTDDESGQPANAAADEKSRLLEESKKWKARAHAAEKTIADQKSNQAKEAGEYKKLYEQLQAETDTKTKKFVTREVKRTVADLAKSQGCLDPEILLQIGNRDLIQVEEDGEEIKISGVDVFVAEVKKARPYLFQNAKAPAINAAMPGAKITPSADDRVITRDDLSRLSAEDLKQAFANVFTKQPL